MMVGLVAILASTTLVAGAWVWAQRPWRPTSTTTDAHGAPRWEAYLTEERGQPAAVLVDLHWHCNAEAAPLTEALWVVLDMAHPGRYGVGTAEEADRIAAVEQRLLDRLLVACGAAFVGRVRAQGTWRLLFMAPPDRDAVRIAADELTERGLTSFRCLAVHDPQWSAYHRCLAPDAERLRWIENARAFQEITSKGEPIGVERAIEHRVRFTDRRSSQRFAELAALYGFEVRGVRGAARDLVVHVVREDVVDLERVHEVVMELSHLARSCSGTYQGWSCLAAAA